MGISRQELYNQIWAEPITKVAERHGVSDSYLVRVLKRLNIPRPPAGYWAKLAANKAVAVRPTLPEPLTGDELEWCREHESPTRVPFAIPKHSSIDQIDTSKKKGRGSRHALLKESWQYFQGVSESQTGHLRPIKKNLPDLIVTKNTLDRAFMLANDFFALLHSKGHRVLLAPPSQHLPRPNVVLDENGKEYSQHPSLWTPGKPTLIYIGTIPLGLTIFEGTIRVRGHNVNGQFVLAKEGELEPRNWKSPHDFTYEKNLLTGRLCVRIYAPHPLVTWSKQWREEQGKTLKDIFPLILSDLVDCAKTVAAMITEAENQYELENQKWRSRLNEEGRQKALKDSKDELLSIIEAWTEMQKIEIFFQDIESKTTHLDPTERDKILTRLASRLLCTESR